jgi:hypothetical protein
MGFFFQAIGNVGMVDTYSYNVSPGRPAVPNVSETMG